MEMTIFATPGRLEIGAAGNQEIIQNIKIIVTTWKGSVPLDREFGIDASFIDKPLPVAKALARAAIVDAVHRYEPRVEITNIDWRQTQSNVMIGRLAPVLSIRIK